MADELTARQVKGRLKKTLDAVNDRWFVDDSSKFGIDHFNTFMMAMGPVLRQNTLVLGEPGFGKTTGARTLTSVLYGLPYDLVHAMEFRGTGQATKGDVLARPDFHLMQKEGEVTVFRNSVYSPAPIADEFTRYTEAIQTVLMDPIDTGRFTSDYGHSFGSGRKLPFLATSNYDKFSFEHLIAPLRDRFGISLELGSAGPFRDDVVLEADERRAEDLTDPRMTERILDLLAGRDPQGRTSYNGGADYFNKQIEKYAKDHDFDVVHKTTSDDYRIRQVVMMNDSEYSPAFGKRLKKKHGIDTLTQEDLDTLGKKIKEIPLSMEANIFYVMVHSELNDHPYMGQKRFTDDIPTDKWQALSSEKVHSAFSPRAATAWKNYSQAVAFWTGMTQVSKEVMHDMFPYVYGHRIQPEDTFGDSIGEGIRDTKMFKEHELSHRLLTDPSNGLDVRFAEHKRGLELLNTYINRPERNLSPALREEAERLLERGRSISDASHPVYHRWHDEVLRRAAEQARG